MKMRTTIIIALLICLESFAQNGINYKAIVKDANGNVLILSPVTIQFIIYEGVALTNNVYQESHTINTDPNGLLIVNIGEGTTSDTFADISWDNDNHYLNVQINTGAGLIDLGTTVFNTVPYALQAEKASNAFSGNYDDLADAPIITAPTGLEALDEGNGIGWRLVGSDSDDYASLGFNAVDLSYSDGVSPSNTYGALGSYSFAVGYRARASGNSSIAMGYRTLASNAYSIATGHHTIASGEFSVAMGKSTNAEAYTSTAMGRFNIGGGNATSWVDTDPLFEIGNGTSPQSKRNALTVLKNGTSTLNSSINNNPDLVLGGTANSAAGDDGIIASDPLYAGSDIFLRSNDAVVVQLDTNNDESGEFYIEDHNATKLFEVEDIGGAMITVPSVVGQPGLDIQASFGPGIVIDADIGADISGFQVGLRTSNSANPVFRRADLILGGTENSAAGDDGIIASDLRYAGSDIFLRSNDAVVVQLDVDQDELGQFEVRNGSNSVVFNVNDTGNANLTGSLSQNSDRRLKKDITNLPYGLNEVLQLQPKAYKWKNKEQKRKSLGLIAQEVQPIIKEIVNVSDDEQKTLGISYTELIPVLINAIKEQNKRINELEARLDSQQNTELATKD